MISSHLHSSLLPLFIRLIKLLMKCTDFTFNAAINVLNHMLQDIVHIQMHSSKLSCYVVNLIPFCSLLERVLSHVNFLPLKCTLNISKTYKTRGAIELQLNRNFYHTHTCNPDIFHRDNLFLSHFCESFNIFVSRSLKT